MSSSTREQAKRYLSEHQIPQMFEALLSSLMLEKPEDPVVYIEKKMAMIKEIGVQNVNWETFVYNLHPYRDALRRRLIRDKSSFDKEYERDHGIVSEQSRENVMPPIGSEFNCAYKPEVFQLTEAQT